MVFKIDLRLRYVFSVVMLFNLVAACSGGGRTQPPATSPGGRAPGSAVATSTLEPSPVPTTAAPTQTTVPSSPTAPPIQTQPGLNDLTDLETLKAVFNQDAGRPRLIMLLSTGCPSCLLGAHWIDQVLLRQNPNLDLAVYAIWFTTVPENLLGPGIDPRWDEGTLKDPRVVHFWDPQRLASSWLAEHQTYEGPQHSALARTVGGLIWGSAIWDTYFLYGPQAEWGDDLSGLMSSAYPIAHHWGDIRHALGVERPPADSASDSATYRIERQESLVTYEVSEVLAGKDLNNAIGMTQAITGTLQLDPQDPGQSRVGDIQVDISTLRSDNWLRDDRLRNQFLESARFPQAVFTPGVLQDLPDAYTPGQELSFDMPGELEVRETRAPVNFHVIASLEEGWLTGTATATLEMTDFGFDPPALGGGLIKADNEVNLRIDFAARKEIVGGG
jgi:polyisoprenoid-binding protein YceI